MIILVNRSECCVVYSRPFSARSYDMVFRKYGVSRGKKKSGGLRLRSAVVCWNSASGGLQILLGLSNFVRFRLAPPRSSGHRSTTPVFLYRRFRLSLRVYLKGPRLPLELPLWYDLFLAEFGPGNSPVPPGLYPFSVALQRFPAGRPSSSGLLRTGDLSYSWDGFLSNTKKCDLGKKIHSQYQLKIPSC